MTERRQTFQAGALVLFFLGVLIATVVGFAAKSWMPPVASEHGRGVDAMIRYCLIATGAIFAIGHLVLAWFVWRYGRATPTGSPRTSPRAERWWTVLPVLGMTGVAEVGVLVIGVPVWGSMHSPPPDDAIVVEIAARQFEWIVRYPGKDATFGRIDPRFIHAVDNPAGLDEDDPASADDLVFVNELHLPAGRMAFLRLRSRDVLHSFSVAAFRVKQDIIPGIVGSTQFVPTLPGRYEIACAELCGLGHYRMRGFTYIQTSEEYEKWLAEQIGWFE